MALNQAPTPAAPQNGQTTGRTAPTYEFCRTAQWSPEDEERILEPYKYITSTSGKDIRTRMINAFNLWLDVPEDKLAVIGRVIGMLHNASLLIDDVEDDSQLRRGSPVAHKIYGIPQVINTANYVYFQAFAELSRIKSSDPSTDLNSIVIEELLNLHRGQGLDLLWRDALECPSERDYILMVNNKTGGLFQLAIRLMMATARRNIGLNYIPFVNDFGIFFQIRDDFCNLCAKDYATNKGYAEDLTEGKFSFPIVHGVNSNRNDRSLLSILQKRTTSPILKDHAIAYLKNRTHSFEYTQRVLYKLECQVRGELEQLGGNPGLEAIVDLLSQPI
ncbi:terpenoid synthase [Gloeophyllum trabeum ATCC 11539]|uniref:(2E,6E)-farnesyl diphosphate synthase n=1 Tax=Gloeophyllum trabeum (strain ATCC 11539 / FP-39264 / Madison 617) TaxID=670483 RepID=S7PZQ6_GLOTA|nr:terpenoid synthase [Gloeophyllum trabeum ATCC 11539]EPQ52777.1 terpenoid synthase [Gloeophyllum trabeum ATCC 11539]